MPRFEEEFLAFEFGNRWRVFKLDEHRVILWLEHDWPSRPQQRKKVLASVRANVFKQKLTWLTNRVLVCGSDKQGLPDVQVSNLPRPR